MVCSVLVLISWRAEKGLWDQYVGVSNVLFLLTEKSINHPSRNQSTETLSRENQVLRKASNEMLYSID